LAALRLGSEGIDVSELHHIEFIAAPPNKGMQLTAKSVLSFAKRRAKARPLLSAADARG